MEGSESCTQRGLVSFGHDAFGIFFAGQADTTQTSRDPLSLLSPTVRRIKLMPPYSV
jgi:hypothetical protein